MVKCMLLWWTQSVNTETQRASCTGPRSKCGHCSPDGLVRVLASAKHSREPCFSVCWSSLWSRWSPFSRILSWRGPLIALAAATWKEVACGGLSWWRSELAVWVEALCALPAAPPPPPALGCPFCWNTGAWEKVVQGVWGTPFQTRLILN